MRLLRRNCTRFEYKKYMGQEEILYNGRHTGNFQPVYSEPVQYIGNISAPSGTAQNQLFGITTEYTHVLLMDRPDVDIDETGIVTWKGKEYSVKAVRPSLNSVQIALKQRITSRD